MSYLIRCMIFVAGIMSIATPAFALEPCKKGVKYIDISAGIAEPFPAQPPDSESLNADGSVKEQGWHNLKRAERPLRIICYYGDGEKETIDLPANIDVCLRYPGRVVCK